MKTGYLNILFLLTLIIPCLAPGGVYSADLTVRIDQAALKSHSGRTVLKLFVSVLDSQGAAVEGIDSSGFSIIEDGSRHSDRIDLETFAASKQKLAYLIALDTRAQLPTSLTLVGHGLQSFITDLGFRHTGLIMTYTGQPELLIGPTRDIALLRQALIDLEPSSGPPRLSDGLIKGIRELDEYVDPEPRSEQTPLLRKVLIVFTDGSDRESVFSREAAFEKIIRSNAALFVLAYGIEARGSLNALAQLSKDTGGDYYFTHIPEEIESTLAIIANNLKKQYILTYISDKIKFRGRGHTIRIEVMKGDDRGMAEYTFITPEKPDRFLKRVPFIK